MTAAADRDLGLGLDLKSWLARIQQLHPNEIDMGLERLGVVARRLGLTLTRTDDSPLVITVTGTNGKGSHVAVIDAVLRAAGKRVGSYTSPHLLHYNERICIQGEPVSDASIVQAFVSIEQARKDVSLTYFEFGTLAALLIFQQAGLDVMVLEVGLGGRLDAVNIVDADIAVISSIGLDHQEWLGDTRDAIAVEKAGIFRAGKAVVCTESDPPAALLQSAAALSCPVYRAGHDFMASPSLVDDSWSWRGRSAPSASDGVSQSRQLTVSGLPPATLAVNNIAGALQAVCLSGLLPPEPWLQSQLPAVLARLQLPGRQQWILPPEVPVPVVMDVAHNPQAGQSLAAAIQHRRQQILLQQGRIASVRVVLAMMADKDHAGFYQALEKQTDFWYIAHFDLPRCLPAETLTEKLRQLGAAGRTMAALTPFTSVGEALAAACNDAEDGDIIVVTGSFITVSDAMSSISARQ
ncbi:bifunctional tetrahydrofolate synthase/dihydrofolate synthase [Pseudohongiella acticola]|jgi:dihydrofolate synthase / folylpolyglutamate synthase|uniref:bifunctional tetrahydrofolate synthase/dihydrofolate synthase n=1 Tax=Pseudohongiella acticola TaxID=1524254 RepID=UPI0030ED1B8D